jgi:hypothetical protein
LTSNTFLNLPDGKKTEGTMKFSQDGTFTLTGYKSQGKWEQISENKIKLELNERKYKFEFDENYV